MGKGRDEIAKTILNYLREHADAGDTLDGISRWWIQSRKREVPVEAIHAALRALVHEGALREIKTRNDSTFYSLAKSSSRRR